MGHCAKLSLQETLTGQRKEVEQRVAMVWRSTAETQAASSGRHWLRKVSNANGLTLSFPKGVLKSSVGQTATLLPILRQHVLSCVECCLNVGGNYVGWVLRRNRRVKFGGEP